MITTEQLEKWKKLHAEATSGPWNVWDGPAYVGGGKDLCIGAGKDWLANMDHRRCEYKRYMEMRAAGFSPQDCPQFRECDPPGQCDVCQIADDDEITKEQQANADFIAESRVAVPALIAEVERLRNMLGSYIK